MAETLTQYCQPADFNAETQTCAAPYWGPAQGFLPDLSAEDGVLISAAIISCWAIGFITKQGRKMQGNL